MTAIFPGGLTQAQYLDASYFNALWQELFNQGQISLLVPPVAGQHWWRTAIVLLGAMIAWFLLLRRATPDIWFEGTARVRALAGRGHA